mgnify:CR=1 FL=1
MTAEEFHEAYREALSALFRTSPNTRENLEACEACAALYDLNPAMADAIDDTFGQA